MNISCNSDLYWFWKALFVLICASDPFIDNEKGCICSCFCRKHEQSEDQLGCKSDILARLSKPLYF